MTDAGFSSLVWPAAPAELNLSSDEVHVWRALLNPRPEELPRLEATLAPDEISRAARFVFQRDRESFVAARGILRELLGAYLGQPPAALKFDSGPRGKPALKDCAPWMRFNLAHSHGMALYAFAKGREVGVDIELLRPDFGGMEVAERFFSPREVAALRALPPGLRVDGFFTCWTKKEAYVKASGVGLEIPLDSFDVSLSAAASEELCGPGNVNWTLHSFRPAARYVAALVGEGRGWRFRGFEWTPVL